MPKFYFLVAAILALAILPSLSVSSESSNLSSWLKPEPPVFKTVQSAVPPESVPLYGYQDCLPKTKLVTVPANPLKAQVEISYTTCAVPTAYGQHGASDGNIQLYDTSLAGPLKNSQGVSQLTSAIPASNHATYAQGALYGAYRYIIRDLAKNIDTVVQPNGSIFHKLKAGVTGIGIKNANGELIAFASTRFSTNGKWMIGDVHQRGMTRVNVETGETLVFGSPYNHSVGTRPDFVSAISGDGRFVLMSDPSYGVLQIYDLSTCVLNADRTRQATCKSRDLLSFTKTNIPGYRSVWHAQFSTNHTLRLYIQTVEAGRIKHGYYTLTAAGEAESMLDYLALGDSFSSGEGAFNYKTGTDAREPLNSCHLSLISYPYLLAAKINSGSTQSVACSGARLRDMINSNYTEELAQSKGKNGAAENESILNDYMVGYRPQILFVEKNKPARLTMSIGGNDIGFGKIILACLGTGTCYSQPQERLNLVYTINAQYNRLVAAYERIRQDASTGAHIYIVGYPLLVDPKGNCAVNVHLDKQELELTNQIVVYLNSVIKRAALKAGVTYVDTEQALSGHRLCEAASPDVAIHGITAGDDKTFSLPLGTNYTLDGYFTGRESYHPNQLGHKLLSETIARQTNDLTTPNPSAGAVVPDPSAIDAGGLLGESGLNLLPRKITFEEGMTDNILVRGQKHQLNIDGLQPGTSASLQIHSSPLNIGTFVSSGAGQLSTDFSLPASLQPGLHVLHLQAKNRAGEDIDIQKPVYVAASKLDIDGDSIPNSQEKCLIVEPADVDIDKDGIDDGCDGMIGNPPPEPLVVSAPLPAKPVKTSQASLLIGSIQQTEPAIQTYPTLLQSSVVHSMLTSDKPRVLASATLLPAQSPARLGQAISVNQDPQPESKKQHPKTIFYILAATILGICFGLLARKKWRKRP